MSLPKSPTDPSLEWHILLRGQRSGPYTLLALYDLLETLPDGWSTPVWRPGMLDWRAAQRVDALLQGTERSPREAARVWTEDALPSALSTGAPAVLFETPREATVAMRPESPRRPVAPESAKTTRDLPTYRPAPSKSPRSRRPLLLATAIACLLALSAALVVWRSRRAPAPERVTTPTPLTQPPTSQPAPEPEPEPEPASPPPATVTQAAPPSPAGNVAPPAIPARAEATSENAPAKSNVTSVRIRAAWAPIRATADAQGVVLCSVPRGSVLSAFGERPGTRARWFAVRCDAQTEGWVHENFLARVQP